MRINNRPIGADHPPYIIAEVSANHGGSLERALQTLDAAKAAGADAVKIQSYTAASMTIRSDRPEFQIEGGLWAGRSLYELYEEAHTPYAWHGALFDHARAIGLTLFSTPFDEAAVAMLEDLGAPAYKIASFELTDLGLIRAAAATGKALILSTGLADESEIAQALEAAKRAASVLLLHCISAYPAPLSEANLRSIPYLAERFKVPVGLSDHTLGSVAAQGAVALGAVAIEKHFTLDRTLGGPDSAFSAEPEELAALKRACDALHGALGQKALIRPEAEADNRRFRRSLYVVVPVKKGERFSPKNLRRIRPGLGLSAALYERVLGREATRDIAPGEALCESMIDGGENLIK